MPDVPPVSLLFVPGHRERMVDKAVSLEADAIVFDLEDSVPPAQKELARDLVGRTLSNWPDDAPRPFVRINPPRDGALDHDAEVLASHPDAGIVVPKVDIALELAGLRDRPALDGRETIVTIETPRAIFRLEEIARAPNVDGLCLGGEDLAMALGMRRTREATEFAVPRFLIVAAARSAGIAAYDAICPEFRDPEVVAADAATGAAAGFDGKFAIHPAQLPIIHREFRPPDDELDLASRVIEAYDAAVARGEGAVAVDGQMIDPPVAGRYRTMVRRWGRRDKELGHRE